MMGFNYKRMTYAGILALNTKVAVCPSSIRQLVFIYFFYFFQTKRAYRFTRCHHHYHS